MRVIVGNDYYDSAMAYGHDKTVTFVRSNELILNDEDMSKNGFYTKSFQLILSKSPIDKDEFRYDHSHSFSFNERKNSSYYSNDYYLTPVCVVIADKIYSGIKQTSAGGTDIAVFWDKKSFDSHMATIGIYYKDFSHRNYDYYGKSKLSNFDHYFNVETVSQSQLAWLISNRVSILTYEKNTYTKESWRQNGYNLRYFQFYKKLDAFSIFQELEMWIGGILPKDGNPMVEITDDKIKIAKHGFDKFSFRKLKTNA